MAKRNRVRKEESNFGDPLRFLQTMSEKYGVDLSKRHDVTPFNESNDTFYQTGDSKSKKDRHDHCLDVGLWPYDRTHSHPFDPHVFELPVKLVKFMYGARENFYGNRTLEREERMIKGRSLEDLHIMEDDFDVFGKHRDNVYLCVHYDAVNFNPEDFINGDTKTNGGPRDFEESIVMINIADNGIKNPVIVDNFGLPDFKGETVFGNNHLAPDFQDVIDYSTEDFRPWINRMFEHHTGVPKDEWHDPRMYDPHSEIEKIVDESVGVLFSGDEREGIERRIQEARLNMRRGWVSIPRLNLGAIRLPNPGMKDIERDTFVTNATPYLVEYLDALGVMSREEAESLAERRLVNYFIHDRGFQLSRERATEIVEQLNGSDSEETEMEGVA